MKNNNLIKELDTHFNAFAKEKDFDTFHSNLSEYFNFIENTHPFNDLARSIFTSKTSMFTVRNNIKGIYDMFVHNKRDVRFSVSPTTISGSGINLFHKQLITQYKKLYGSEKGQYLLLEDDFFIYNGSNLNLKENTFPYDILRAIYIKLDGESGELDYKTLYKELRKLRKFKNQTNTYIQNRILKYITSSTDGLGTKIKPVENNGFRLIEPIKGVGIRFNNGDR